VTDRAVFTLEVAFVALCFAAYIWRLSRRRALSFKYTIGWMSVCLFGIFASPLVFLVTPLAKTIAVAVILIQLSVSISGNQRKMETLVRENSLLRESLGISLKDKKSEET
jgi:hypothetical protein